MGAGEQLTSLGRVKNWLEITGDDTASDELLNALIASASTFILNYLSRDSIGLQEHEEVYDGYGSTYMVLRHEPVYEVSALSFNGTAIREATGNGFNQSVGNGWRWASGRLNLYGYRFPRVKGGVFLKYSSGFVFAEKATVPGTPFEVKTKFHWLSDIGVQYLGSGTALVKVDSNPAEGEYTVDDEGKYTFNSTQTNSILLITYSFVPADIEQAAWEMVGERYRYMDRIGYVSKSLGGQETVTFARDTMAPYIKQLLNPYKRVVPVA